MEKLFVFVSVDVVPMRSSVLSLFSLRLRRVNQDLISPRQSEGGEVDGRVEVGLVDG